ncbi:hypothetical protein [uncultured Streptococcus sp.]|uniref:hypothetical protein n=1 Tax=uncultured Streptococcus sp. TaxID=83427 RepID=UPI002889AA05|nr:hypothetical protein [uncultured Streptococcus sp.]
MTTNELQKDHDVDIIDSESKEHELIEMSQVMATLSQISSGTDFSDKITTEHITRYLDGAEKNMTLAFEEKKHSKYFILALAIIVSIVFIILVVILKDKPDVLEKLIYSVGGLFTGFAGGYGLGKKRED